MGKKVRLYLEPDVPASRRTEADEEKGIALDLIIIHIWIALTVATLMIPVLALSLFRFIFTIPALIFIPGYCLTAVLFPDNRTISDIRRVALSLGLSVAVVSLVVALLHVSAWGIQLNPLILIIVILVVLSGPVVQYRRSRLPREVRFRLSLFRPSDDRKRTEIAQETPSGNRTLHIIALILILAILCSPAMYILNMAIPRGKDTGILVKQGCTSQPDSTIIIRNTSPLPLTTGVTVPVTTPARNVTPEEQVKDDAAGPPGHGAVTDAGNGSREGP
jgi:uncharacterized membrane protein